MLVCHVCGIQFKSTKANFKRHLKYKHNIIENVEYNINCLESTCSYKCLKLNELRNHLENNHNIVQEIEELHFQNIQEFTKWKELEEVKSKFSWVKHRGFKQNTGYYFCNRSGKKRVLPVEQRKRMLKSQGSCKIDAACTSCIILKIISKDNLKVVYYKTHYGHTVNIQHVPLNMNVRKTIASQLLQGVSSTAILDKIRESVEDDFERLHLTTRKDIHNISQAFNIYDKAIKHANDAVSVDMWVNEVSQKTDNCIILYKKQGNVCKDIILKKEDFVLGIMTHSQVEMLKKFGNDGIICMDGTHGTNPYDFVLISVLVVDDFGEGFPVAFLITNREDYTTLKYFIASIHKITGNIKAKVFMSDDADQYFASWSAVMNSSTTKKLLCAWHIDRAWRNKIGLIKNKEKQEQVYKMLCVLRQESNKEDFIKYLTSFKNVIQDDPDIIEFGNYFKTNYENRWPVWAFCYRIGSSINTNMYLESMHKVLKYIYLKGTACKRLDKTIHVLLKFIRDKQFSRVIKLTKGKVTNRIANINKSHVNAVNSKDMTVLSGATDWTVSSGLNTYNVNQYSIEEGHCCKLLCLACGVCVHRYSCTCMDFLTHSNMCKHIHKVCIEVNNINPVTSEINKENREDVELDMHLNVLKKSNDTTKVIQKITDNITILSASPWNTFTDQNVLSKVNSLLGSAVNLISCAPSSAFTEIKNQEAPSNKKIETQFRFQSTKKKRKTVSRLSKPSLSEIEDIKNHLV